MSSKLQGIGVSKGICIGPAYVYYRELPEVLEYSISKYSADDEIKRFEDARIEAQQQLNNIKNNIASDTPHDITLFIDTHLLMLDDPVLYEDTVSHIRARLCNAEWALQVQVERIVKVFDDMDDPYLKTRKDDIIHVTERIQRCLMNEPEFNHAEDKLDSDKLGDHLKDRIIVADDLTPADTLLMQHQKIAGFITEYGGPLSHTAILARNLGIPAIVGVHDAKHLIQANELIVLDGNTGTIHINPAKKELTHFRSLMRDERQRRKLLFDLKNKPAKTKDGFKINLHGNIDRPADVRALRQYDHTGVGLYRTEMLFIEHNQLPSEEEQFETYRRALRSLKGHPLTIRTTDLGADKELANTTQHGPLVHNPALGLRAIRRCLKDPSMFLPQIKAILRTAGYGPTHMMIPMISCVSELEQALELIEQAKSELKSRRVRFDPEIKIGAMIEVPSAALVADSLASKLDFLSIGTNDLIQYTLAFDRIDDEVSYLYNPLHPAVLKLIQMTLNAGEAQGIRVSMCGEMASDTLYTRLLLGMGLQCFSVQANSLLDVKHIINHSEITHLRPLTEKIMSLSDPREIKLAVDELNQQFS
ncbi:MAG: phosphoenolpyruvate--protein phosphotransferase [endosymbiont of Galathealinum brachiosum]|uniref:Phosphoenolpyruvate-protein phosphotransferase n=1 Tax=endosymbiont of Galathealinum brachiosum TaxID=2200906 RepID=A0A370DB11_9GAMM|nr:MAG: phosphoenolpyruvate--protein phosphotransferase [endosymbiont of Galathealinum brachiosum]